MNEQPRRGLVLLGAALSLGLLGDLTLRATPWGLNVFVCAAALAGTGIWMVQREGTESRRRVQGLLLIAAVLSAAFAWRDAEELKIILSLTIFLVLGLVAWTAGGGSLLAAAPVQYVLGFAVAVFRVAIGFPLLLVWDAPRSALREGLERGQIVSGGRRLISVGIGLVIAIPLLIFFGLLLASADPVFEKVLSGIVFFDLGDLFLHMFLIFFWAWPAGGLLRTLVTDGPARPADASEGWFPRLGVIEAGVALGLLNLLFLSFVLVQFRYFFGGIETVLSTHGLTFAAYARQGFFELLWVAIFVLSLLLLADWLLRDEGPKGRRAYQILAGVQVGLLLVITVSAFHKLAMYVQEFGLTSARIIPAAFMIWLAAAFIWFAATVLRGRREQFSFGAFVLALLCVASLVAVNPDDLSLRTNLARAQEGKEFDVYHAARLSWDAVPTLLERFSELDQVDQNLAGQRLLTRWGRMTGNESWKNWSWARQRARQALEEHETMLVGVLSGDAPQDIPQLLEHFSALPHEAQCRTATKMFKRESEATSEDDENWDTRMALQAIRNHRTELESLHCE